jgi:hypothetical protein
VGRAAAFTHSAKQLSRSGAGALKIVDVDTLANSACGSLACGGPFLWIGRKRLALAEDGNHTPHPTMHDQAFRRMFQFGLVPRSTVAYLDVDLLAGLDQISVLPRAQGQ